MADAQPQQLTLNIRLRDEATLENFFPGPDEEPLVNAVAGQTQLAGEPLIYLHGGAGCGKSHLLQAACHRAQGPVLYLPLSQLAASDPNAILQGMDSLGLVCIDDLHEIAGRGDWEEALFHFFNRARESTCRLLVSADCSPRQLALELADLRSRLSWGVVYRLQAADDDRRMAILRARAALRGLQLPVEVARFILNRAPRSLESLLSLLESLDQAALTQKRALSIPFVKQVLGW